MPVTTYKDTRIFANVYGESYQYIAPATSLSISVQSNLESSRILAPNQNNNLRIGGERSAKINISFPACRQQVIGQYVLFNFADVTLRQLTGNNYITSLIIAGKEFFNCYLDNASVEISPFSPVMVSADFTCLNPPENTPFTDNIYNSPSMSDDIASGIAYGFNTIITNGSTLSDSNRESISYKINCNRSYTTSIGQTSPDNVFLNGVEKELIIKSRDIGSFIDYSSYGEAVNINPRNSLNQSVVIGGFGMSANSRIVSQNLSMSEGDILAGDITLREVVL